jgi:hypothetical protein
MVERLDPIRRDFREPLPEVDRSRRASPDRSPAGGQDRFPAPAGRAAAEDREASPAGAGDLPLPGGLERELTLLGLILGSRLRARLLHPGEPGAPGIAIIEARTDRIVRILPAASAAGAAARLVQGGVLVDRRV